MKYWLVTTEFPPFGGGIAPYCLYTAEMFDAAGIETRVFFADPGVSEAKIKRVSPKVHLVRYHDRRLSDGAPINNPFGSTAWTSWNTAEILEEAIARWGKPDAIEFQDFGALGYFTLQKRFCLNERFAGVKIVLTAHRPIKHTHATDGQSNYRLPVYFIGEMERWTYRAADAVFYPSEFIEKRLKAPDMGFRHNAGFIVRNPFESTSGQRLGAALTAPAPAQEFAPNSLPDESPWSAIARFAKHTRDVKAWPLGWQRPAPREEAPVFFIGKLQDQKGVRDLVQLMDRWWSEGGPAPLYVYGRDAMIESLQSSMRAHLEARYAKRVDEGLLHFEGSYMRDDLPAILAKAGVVVLPFREECMPYITLEVIASGAPLLCAPGGGQQELIAPELRARLIYDPDDYEDFSAKLDWLRRLSAKQRAEISAQLQAHVASLASYETVLAQKLAAIEKTPAPKSRKAYPYATEIAKSPNTREVESVEGRISVVVPYYNMQNYIADALESVLANEHGDLEIIVVNDGSTEPAALTKLEQIAAHPLYKQFVRVLHKENGGLASARNAGGEAATGEFLLFLDADDMIAPSFIDKCLKLLRAYPNVSYASSWLQEFEGAKGGWAAWPFEFPYGLYHSTQHCTILVRRADWLNHGQNDPAMVYGFEDYEAFVGMTKNGVRGVVIPELLFFYRVRAASMMRGLNNEAQAYLYRIIQQKHPELFRKYADPLLQLVSENGHGAFHGDPTRETATAARLFADQRNSFEFANDAFVADNYAEAERATRGVLLKDGAAEGGRYLLGQILNRRMRGPAEAFEAYSLADRPGDLWPRLMRAALMLEFGARAEARVDLLRLFEEIGKEARAAAMWLANDRLWRGDPNAAFTLADAAASVVTARDAAWGTSVKAQICLGLMRPSDELLDYPQTWEEPWAASMFLAQAMYHLHRADSERALVMLDQIEEEDLPLQFIAHGAARYAELLAHRGKESEALALTAWARRRAKRLLGANMPIVDLDALDATIRAAQSARGDVGAARAARDPDALDAARTAMFAAMPLHTDARCIASDDAMAINHPSQAIWHLDAVLGAPTASSNPWYWSRRFHVLATLGRFEEARGALSEMIAWDQARHACHDVLRTIGDIIAKNPAEAHACLTLLRSDYDDIEDVRLWWCASAIDSGNWSRQVEDDLTALINATENAGRRTWAIYHRGRLAGRLGRIEAARAAARDLLQDGGAEAKQAARGLMQEFSLIGAVEAKS